MENQGNKPYYLKESRNNGKWIIAAGIFFIVFGIISPIFFIFAPVLIGYGIKKIINSRSETNVLFDSAISNYNRKSYKECEDNLNSLLSIDNNNIKAKILLALVKYEIKSYEETVFLLSSIPEEKVKSDLDLQLKLGNSYLYIKEFKKAEAIFKDLIKLQPKSKYLREVLEECGTRE